MTLAGQGIGGMAGGRRGIGAIAWHPDVVRICINFHISLCTLIDDGIVGYSNRNCI